MKPTIFILAGGNDTASPDFAKHLEAEIAQHVTRPKILSCFFAQPVKDWADWYIQWQAWLSQAFHFTFSYDYAKRDTFLEQVDVADVIYLHGGDTAVLLKRLPNARILREHFKGKIVIGSSAGANVLSKKYWSSSRAVPGEGLGVIDTNVMVHYGAPDRDGRKRAMDDWKKEEITFQRYVGQSRIVRLSEGRFVVMVEAI